MAELPVSGSGNTNTVPMFSYVKAPRSAAQYTLMKGVTDFSNLRQFDMFETSYSFLVVCAVPEFMKILGNHYTEIKNYQDAFIHFLEGEFRGLDGIPDITADAGTITNGINELQLINKVNMDTSIQVSMSFYERSGAPITKYLQTYMTGIKDPYSQAKTYHGLIEAGEVTDPGADYEVFTFLYYVTDNTCRKLEKAYLLANAQPTSVPMGTVYNSTRGDITFPEINISFNCFPIMGNKVDQLAAALLEYQLASDTPRSERLILNSNDYDWDTIRRNVQSGADEKGNLVEARSIDSVKKAVASDGKYMGTAKDKYSIAKAK